MLCGSKQSPPLGPGGQGGLQTYQLSHADRNLIEQILEDNQSNLTSVGKDLRKQLNRSIGVSMPTYPVDLHIDQVAWLINQINKFEKHSHDRVLKYLCQDTLPLLKQKLSATTCQPELVEGTPREQHRPKRLWGINTTIASKAFTSAVLFTAAACLIVWAIIEAFHFFTNKTF